MKRNQALARLREGRPINGAAIVYDSPSMVEQAALVGLDYLWLDWRWVATYGLLATAILVLFANVRDALRR